MSWSKFSGFRQAFSQRGQRQDLDLGDKISNKVYKRFVHVDSLRLVQACVIRCVEFSNWLHFLPA